MVYFHLVCTWAHFDDSYHGSNVPSSYLDVHAGFERSKFLSWYSCMVRTFQVPVFMFMHGRTFQVPILMFMHSSNVPSSCLYVHAWFERSKFLSWCSCMVRTFQVPVFMFMHGSNVPSSYLDVHAWFERTKFLLGSRAPMHSPLW